MTAVKGGVALYRFPVSYRALAPIALAPFALSVSGCIDQASVDKAVLVDACIAEANSRAACTCMADAAHEMLDETVFQAMVAGAEGRTEAADDAYYAMTPQQQQSVADFVRAMPGRCNMPPVEGLS